MGALGLLHCFSPLLLRSSVCVSPFAAFLSVAHSTKKKEKTKPSSPCRRHCGLVEMEGKHHTSFPLLAGTLCSSPNPTRDSARASRKARGTEDSNATTADEDVPDSSSQHKELPTFRPLFKPIPLRKGGHPESSLGVGGTKETPRGLVGDYDTERTLQALNAFSSDIDADLSFNNNSPQSARQECEERLRVAQAAEVAVLQRLQTCVKSVLSTSIAGKSRSTAERRGFPFSISNSNDRINASSSPPGINTMAVLLPTTCASTNAIPSDFRSAFQVQQVHIPVGGLTRETKAAYDALRDLLAQCNDWAQVRGDCQDQRGSFALANSSPTATSPPHAAEQSVYKDKNATSSGEGEPEADCSYAQGKHGRINECQNLTAKPNFKGAAKELKERTTDSSGSQEARPSSFISAPLFPQLPNKMSPIRNAVSRASSPPQSATPPSTRSVTEEDDIYFPTPPRKTTQKSSVSDNTKKHASCSVPLGANTAASSTRLALVAEYLKQDKLSAHVDVSSSGCMGSDGLYESALTDDAYNCELYDPPNMLNASSSCAASFSDTQRLPDALHRTVLDSQAKSIRGVPDTAVKTETPFSPPRAELTATDILATITALPPPPPRVFATRKSKKVAKRSNDGTTFTEVMVCGARRATGKRARENWSSGHVHTERTDSTRVRPGPLEGLPYLGVDVEAAAVAANTACRHQRLSSCFCRNSGAGAYLPDGSITSLRSENMGPTFSPQPSRGYVRTRQQRAKDVARIDAVMNAVRRAAGGGCGALRNTSFAQHAPLLATSSAQPQQVRDFAGSDPSTLSASQASSDSVQYTPSQYWEIDFS